MKPQGDTPDPFRCGCTKCEAFWSRMTKGTNMRYMTLAAMNRAEDLSPLMTDLNGNPLQLMVGDRVLVKGKYKGVIKHIGVKDKRLLPKSYIGVQLDENLFAPNNVFYDKDGHRFFHCPMGHGALVKYSECIRLKPLVVPKPKVYGHSMFPSFGHIVRARKVRAQRDPCFNIGFIYLKKEEKSTDLNTIAKKSRLKSAPLPRLTDVRRPITPKVSARQDRSKPIEKEPIAYNLKKTLNKLRAALEAGKRYKESELIQFTR